MTFFPCWRKLYDMRRRNARRSIDYQAYRLLREGVAS
jgi:hypothetical protein